MASTKKLVKYIFTKLLNAKSEEHSKRIQSSIEATCILANPDQKLLRYCRKQIFPVISTQRDSCGNFNLPNYWTNNNCECKNFILKYITSM